MLRVVALERKWIPPYGDCGQRLFVTFSGPRERHSKQIILKNGEDERTSSI